MNFELANSNFDCTICLIAHEKTTYKSPTIELSHQKLRAILPKELETLKKTAEITLGTDLLDIIGWEDIISKVTTCIEVFAPTIINKAIVVIYTHLTSIFTKPPYDEQTKVRTLEMYYLVSRAHS